MLTRMDHFTIVTDRLNETLAFYTMLGLREGPRPDFPVAGFWLYIDSHPVLHVIESTVMPEPRRGVLDHMAYFGEDLAGTATLLDRAGISYRIIRTPRPFSMWQMFFLDPNGSEVEIDFAQDEAPPPNWKSVAGRTDR